MRCIVELFGLPREVTELREVAVELKDGATLRDAVAVLRRQIPTLEERVIRTGEDWVIDFYAFNLNGRFYLDDREAQLRDGDHILLLPLATGG